MRNLAAKLFLLIISSLLTLLAAEWAVRRMPNVSQELIGPLTDDDPNYVYRVKPRLSTRHRNPYFYAVYHTNSRGLRNPEIDPAAPRASGVKRILVLGDSFAFGYGVNDDQTFPVYLESLLNSKSKRVQVINSGQPVWGTAQEIRWLEREGLQYKPDFLILQFFVNDYKENLLNNVIVLENGKLARKEVARANISKTRKITRWIPFYQTLTERSVLFNWIRRSVLVRMEKKDSKGEAPHTTSAGMEEMSKTSYALFKEIQRIAKENRLPLLVIAIPHPFAFTPQKDSYEYKGVYESALANLKKSGLPYIDFQAEILNYSKGKKIDPSTLYIPVDGHFTPEGNRLAAEVLARRISSDWFRSK